MQTRAESSVAIVSDPLKEETEKSGDLTFGMVRVPSTHLETGAWREEVAYLDEGRKIPSDSTLDMSLQTSLTTPAPQVLIKKALVAPNADLAPAGPLKSI